MSDREVLRTLAWVIGLGAVFGALAVAVVGLTRPPEMLSGLLGIAGASTGIMLGFWLAEKTAR